MDRIHPGDRAAVDDAVAMALAGVNGGAYQPEFRTVRPDGTTQWVAACGQAYFDGDGEHTPVPRLVGVNIDITERKLAALALEAALKERTVLLQEVHHRVKNNLAVIGSLFSLQAGVTDNPESRALLEQCRGRVHTMALIHEHLYGNLHFDRVNFLDYTERLAQGVYSTFVADPSRISMELDIDPIELSIQQAVPCALILNELLSNAFKHAFPDQRRGKIRISFHQSVAGCLELVVEDNGIGLPDRTLTAKKPQSLGLRIVEILTKQLDGSLEQEAAEGTRLVLRFPAQHPAPRK
jgi:two-component sensor histidine kinase